jgi:hypothetical protein
MKKHISVADLVMLIGGAVTFVFSFLPFWGQSGFDTSAWGSGLFPLATIPAVLGAAMVLVVVLEQVGTKLPEPVLTFSWRQIELTWGIVAATIMVSFLILDKGGVDLKLGAILMLIGSLAMAVGAFMAVLGKGTNLVAIPGMSDANKDGPPSSPPPPPPPPSSDPRPPAPPPPPL